MKIVTLVENETAQRNLKQKHGLCLYVETEQHKILFDLGPDDTFLHNAEQCGVDIKAVDIVIISHGHADHGGGLSAFLQINHTAKIYIHPDAFLPHYNKVLKVPVYCGLDTKFQNNKRIVYTKEHYIIDKSLFLFSDVEGNRCVPSINNSMRETRGKHRVTDTFTHEQNLIIQENGKVVLIGGCAHRGIVNIIKTAKFLTGKYIDVVISGFHLTDPVLKKTESTEFLDKLAYNLSKFSCQYYTFHCTGRRPYQYLQDKLGDKVAYLRAGDTLVI